MSVKTMDSIKRHIDHMIDIERIESLRLEWFGGEPMMCLNSVVEPISSYAQKKCRQTDIPYVASATTNGYYLVPETIGDIKKLCFDRFQITIDGCKAEHDKVKCVFS